MWLDLTDLGDSILLGLPQTRLKNDLYGSFSTGALSVGAITGDVELRQAPQNLSLYPYAAGGGNAPAVPEAGSTWMLIGGGGLLCVLGRVKSVRFSRRR